MNREQRINDIGIICDKCGCTDKQRARHYDQFVNRQWQPHASLRFKKWWFKQDEFKESLDKDNIGISPVIAQNVGRIWDAYLDAKQVGVA